MSAIFVWLSHLSLALRV